MNMQCTSITSYNKCLTPAVWDFPNITRPFSIMYYVLGGSAFYTFDGVEKPFEKGHLYILPANKTYSLREDPSDKFYSVYIHTYTSPEIDSVIDIDVQADGFLKDTLELIGRYAQEAESGYLYHLTNMLLSYLAGREAMARPQLPERIKEYINSNFVRVFKHNDLSHHFNYSRPHLTRVFKEKYDLTPKQYAQQLVLQEALFLLREGGSVAEIAERLAFSSPENFSRFFKACYGYAPTEYLKRFKDFPL
ncbi:MAG: helix-turn-helix transcriptional regulator [Ruminococcaceae bacterium]|nr:helix-turn-helix transcriptional regulator [Oscillospiraceae bacterium]